MRLAREARLRYFQLCTDAAKDIQRIWRGRAGRLAAEMAKVVLEVQEKAQEAAALEINVRVCCAVCMPSRGYVCLRMLQRLLRGKLGRMKARKQREWWKSRREKEEWAAVYVQRHVRSLIARRVLQVCVCVCVCVYARACTGLCSAT